MTILIKGTNNIDSKKGKDMSSSIRIKSLALIPFLISCLFITNCGVLDKLKESTDAIDNNISAVKSSTQSIILNQDAVQESNKSIHENFNTIKLSSASILENQKIIEASIPIITENIKIVRMTSEAILANKDAINQSTALIRENAEAVRHSSDMIMKNAQAIEKSTKLLSQLNVNPVIGGIIILLLLINIFIVPTLMLYLLWQIKNIALKKT